MNRPDVGVPQKNGIRGRNPTIEKVFDDDNNPIRVDKLANELDPSQWHRIYLRVFPVTDKLPGEECWLVIRRNEGETETKYQFSNAPIDKSIERIGKMSCSRYWIERAIEDAKGEEV
ncbi:Uncharacterised protein [uncultured archaeon]|nr:Uncharacterised protein [uncultured archaeon]